MFKIAAVALFCLSLFLFADAQVCTQNQIRLFNGSSSSNGVLQVCNSSRVWTDVCDYYWNNNYHSVVVCKQLGFTSSTPVTVLNAGPASTGKFTYASTSSYCSTSSSVITSCLQTYAWPLQYTSYCSITRDTVYIDCNPDIGDATVGQARLYDVKNKRVSTEGMLQIGDAGRSWTAVCDYRWSCNHAVTACKQLGYSNPIPYYRINAGSWIKFGYGPYSYCSSSATNLNSCSSYASRYRTDPSYCNTNRDTVYLKCSNNYVRPTCSPNYSVRLVGGKDSSEGRVEVCYNGFWHAVCGTYLDRYFASTVCNQLGFTGNNISTTITDGRYGCGNISTYFTDSIYCNRMRNSLSSCSFYGSSSSSKCTTQCNSYCTGIKCYSSGNCNEGEVRLVNGTEEREGRLEVCFQGVWGTVCSYDFTRSAAYIACKQLGYNDTNDAIIDTYGYNKYGGGDRPFVYSNVDCFGLETRLSQCDKRVNPKFSCYYQAIVGLKCLEICNEGKIRLVGGKNPLEGTVEICTEERWKLISENGWDDTDASVVCRQLNHTGGEAVLNSLFGEPKRAIVYSNVNCRGTETELKNCTHNRLYPERVDGDVAGVRCSSGSTTTPPGTLPIAANITTNIGCSSMEFALRGCSQACYEKTDHCIGSKLLESTGDSCVCASCTESRSEPSMGLTITLDDARNYRCNTYCKTMMKCFDGTCDSSKKKCLCRYCSSRNREILQPLN